MYNAIVARIRVKSFPDFVRGDGKVEKIERLMLGDCRGHQVIVGRDTTDNSLVVFFPVDGALSDEFLRAKDLYKRKDENGNQVGGMFELDRRVKMIKLKGQYSMGFCCPVELLDWTGADLSKVKEGDEFCELNGHKVCEKYVTRATRQARTDRLQNTQLTLRKRALRMFPEHIDTSHFKRTSHAIPVGSLIILTEKVHGTSHRLALTRSEPVNDAVGIYADLARKRNVKIGEEFQSIQERLGAETIFTEAVEDLDGSVGGMTLMKRKLVNETRNLHKVVKTKLTRLDYGVSRQIERAVDCTTGLLNRIGIDPRPWRYVNGTRRVTLETRPSEGYYGTDKFRYDATKNIKLHPGEMIYGELVGFTDTGVAIQHQSTVESGEKQLTKMFGQSMNYTYGANKGECLLFVYRITHLCDDGTQIELPWSQVVGRCKELGLKTVPTLECFVYDGNECALRDKVDHMVNDGIKASTLDARHLMEGIVVRAETPDGRTLWMKEKSLLFTLCEFGMKSDENYVDREETQEEAA